MLYANFLDKTTCGGNDGFMGFVSDIKPFMTKQADGEQDFVEVVGEYVEQGNYIKLSEGNGEGSEFNTKAFGCNEERALKENDNFQRNKLEDMVLLVDKIRLIDGVKAYMRVVPVGDAMLVSLYGGAAEFFVYGGWIPMNRSGKAINQDSKRYEMSVGRVLDFARITDHESGYNMVKDGSFTCEFLIATNKTKETTTKCKVFSDEFILFREDKVQKERKRVQAVKERQEKEKEEKRLKLEEFKKYQAKKAEEDAKREEQEKAEKEAKKASRKASSGKSSSGSRKSIKEGDIVSSDDAANAFMDILRANGYKG